MYVYIYTIQYIPFVSCITCQALTGRRLPPRPRRAKRPSWAWRQRPGGTVDPWEKPWKMLGKTMENSGKTMENAGENGEKWILSLRNLIFLAMNNWYVARFFCKWWSAALPAWKTAPRPSPVRIKCNASLQWLPQWYHWVQSQGEDWHSSSPSSRSLAEELSNFARITRTVHGVVWMRLFDHR